MEKIKREKKIIKENPSKSSSTVYETVIWNDGSISCNCKGWIFSGQVRGCTHTKAMVTEQLGVLANAVRSGEIDKFAEEFHQEKLVEELEAGKNEFAKLFINIKVN